MSFFRPARPEYVKKKKKKKRKKKEKKKNTKKNPQNFWIYTYTILVIKLSIICMVYRSSLFSYITVKQGYGEIYIINILFYDFIVNKICVSWVVIFLGFELITSSLVDILANFPSFTTFSTIKMPHSKQNTYLGNATQESESFRIFLPLLYFALIDKNMYTCYFRVYWI